MVSYDGFLEYIETTSEVYKRRPMGSLRENSSVRSEHVSGGQALLAGHSGSADVLLANDLHDDRPVVQVVDELVREKRIQTRIYRFVEERCG
jgi:hypothetical protein